MQVYENYVFEGGGVKGTAYTGFIQYTEEKGLLKNVKRVAGTSAGSIIAALLAAKLSAQQIHDYIFNVDFRQFEDKGNDLRVLTWYGKYKGQVFLQWLKDILGKATGKPNITFAELQYWGGLDLHTIALSLKKKSLCHFSASTTPNVIIAEAVRCSMSIPVFFEAFQLTQGGDPKELFVDGGTVWNLPVELFDTEKGPNPATLGICLYDYQNQNTDTDLGQDNFGKYALTLVEAIVGGQSDLLYNTKTNDWRLVRIEDFGISAIDFNLTAQQKQQLYQSGVDYANKFFQQKS